MSRPVALLLTFVLPALAYLAFWPVPVDPQAWNAPRSTGYVGVFAKNTRLQALNYIDLDGASGPEDAAPGPDKNIYISTHNGPIVKVDLERGTVSTFSKPGGRVLGLEFSSEGVLYAADAFRGLLKISAAGTVDVLSNATADGSPIRYANDVDISKSGIVYFTDSSTRFGARENGGTLPASLLDLVEHGAHGRVLRYDPSSKTTNVILDGLNFANGIALSEDGTFFLLVETGTYRILKHWLSGPKTGQTETILTNLPGFPDNINRNRDGTFWVGLVSPRSPVVDALSAYPMLRKVIMRLPAAVRPKPQRYGFAMRIDGDGKVLEVLQDPEGRYALVTGAIDVDDKRTIVTSLTEKRLGILERP